MRFFENRLQITINKGVELNAKNCCKHQENFRINKNCENHNKKEKYLLFTWHFQLNSFFNTSAISSVYLHRIITDPLYFNFHL